MVSLMLINGEDDDDDDGGGGGGALIVGLIGWFAMGSLILITRR